MIIANAKVSHATKINDIDEDVFEGRSQDVPSHRTFTYKDRHPYVNPSDARERCQILLGAATKMLNATIIMMLLLAIIVISIQYRYNRMFE